MNLPQENINTKRLTVDEFKSLRSQIATTSSRDTINTESLRSQFATLENGIGVLT